VQPSHDALRVREDGRAFVRDDQPAWRRFAQRGDPQRREGGQEGREATRDRPASAGYPAAAREDDGDHGDRTSE